MRHIKGKNVKKKILETIIKKKESQYNFQNARILFLPILSDFCRCCHLRRGQKFCNAECSQ